MSDVSHSESRLSNHAKILIAAGVSVLVVFLLTMGFFSTLFGNQESLSKETKNTKSTYQEAWAPYLTTVDNDKVGSILVDLGLKEIAPLKDKTNLLRIAIKVKMPMESGMAPPEEADVLNEIVEDLNDALLVKYDAVFAGRLNCDGEFTTYHYIGDSTGYEKAVSDVMSLYSQYKYELLLREEKKWESYLEFLYPLPIQLQSIKNSFGLQGLLQHGDKLERERIVDHWIYFKSEADREMFISKLHGHGFNVVSKNKIDVNDGYSFQLRIARKDKVDHASLDKYVLQLWELAQGCNGNYDGWETSFVKD